MAAVTLSTGYIVHVQSLRCTDVINGLQDWRNEYNWTSGKTSAAVYHYYACSASPVAAGTLVYRQDEAVAATTGSYASISSVSDDAGYSFDVFPVQTLIYMAAIFFAAAIGIRTGLKL